MKFSLFFRTDAYILCLLLFAGCILMVLLGKFTRNKFVHENEAESKGGVNSLLAALFGLWGFMLAFTFSNSSSRFDSVRSIMVDEANIIRNTILRTDVFADSTRDGFRADLKKYVELRIAYYENASNLDKFCEIKELTLELDKILWEKGIQVSGQPNMGLAAANMLVLLTSMFDTAAKRDALLMASVPEPIQYMLFFLALTISFVGGFTTPVIKLKEWIVITGFVLLASTIIYITLDLGRPMRGIISVDSGEDRMIQLLKMF